MRVRITQVRRLSDLDNIVEMHKQLFVDKVEEIPSFEKGAWWVLSVDGEPAGFAGIHPSRWWDKTAYLCRVGVLEEYQGHGYQKKLIKSREKWARKQGYSWVVTDAALDNPASSNSLISCGYKLWRPHYRWAGYEPALYWKKHIGKIS
jgi:GNAT superfamily N-acetyltransferase